MLVILAYMLVLKVKKDTTTLRNEDIIKQKANVIVKKILCNLPQAELKNVEIQYINENDENSVKTLEIKIFLIINKKTETLVVKV